jgi:hypothetical protein
MVFCRRSYAGFNRIYAEGQIFGAACLAHVRRKMYDLHQSHHSPIAAEALQRIGALYAIEQEIRGATVRSRCSIRCRPGSSRRYRSCRELAMLRVKRLASFLAHRQAPTPLLPGTPGASGCSGPGTSPGSPRSRSSNLGSDDGGERRLSLWNAAPSCHGSFYRCAGGEACAGK